MFRKSVSTFGRTSTSSLRRPFFLSSSSSPSSSSFLASPFLSFPSSDDQHQQRREKHDISVPKFDKYMRPPASGGATTRKAFSYFVIGSASFSYAIGAKNAVVEFLDTLNPAGDVKALANIEVKLSGIPEGTSLRVLWRGKPLFIRHRTEREIQLARETPLEELRDPQKDETRTQKPEWLVLIGVCTHLGCIPVGDAGDFGGWFCPCHGSHYDTSGRIRKGPAPLNLEVPPYYYVDDDKILVGKSSPDES
ncbi:Cytochrome b-c1 complex subunit Rieske, mitochondrial [Balamuthia mandrillaris]